jgi:hypothetical protein
MQICSHHELLYSLDKTQCILKEPINSNRNSLSTTPRSTLQWQRTIQAPNPEHRTCSPGVQYSIKSPSPPPTERGLNVPPSWFTRLLQRQCLQPPATMLAMRHRELFATYIVDHHRVLESADLEKSSRGQIFPGTNHTFPLQLLKSCLDGDDLYTS